MKAEKMPLAINGMCFACGKENPIGLKLDFHLEGEEYVTRFTVKPEYQGWSAIAHGGLLATVLDEVMTRLLWAKGISSVTGRLEVRYRAPASVGETLEVRAHIVRHRHTLIETEAVARRADGAVVAEAKGASLEGRG
jgi:acyl-coenzyme A thioesterase PaaI-like protein